MIVKNICFKMTNMYFFGLRRLYFFKIKKDGGPLLSDGNCDKNRMKYLYQTLGLDGKKKPSFAGIDVNFLQFHYGGFHVNRKQKPGTKRGYAAHGISGNFFSSLGRTGLNRFYSQVSGKRLGGNLFIPVHQHDKRIAGICLHHQCLYDPVFRNAQGNGSGCGSPVFFISVRMEQE